MIREHGVGGLCGDEQPIPDDRRRHPREAEGRGRQDEAAVAVVQGGEEPQEHGVERLGTGRAVDVGSEPGP